MLSSCATKPIATLGETKLPQASDPQSAPTPPPAVVTLPTVGGDVEKCTSGPVVNGQMVCPPKENLTFKCLNCDAREKIIMTWMQKRANQVIKLQCFSDHFTDEKYRSQLIQTNGLTRKQVAEKIKSAVHEIPIKMYDGRKGVYGYTYPNDPTIYLNRYYRTQWDYDNGYWSIDAEVSNAVHEATHKMGFEHDYRRTSRRPYSVPYTANFAVDECIHELQ